MQTLPVAVQKCAKHVDLNKCCRMTFKLQKSASIQPRTNLPKLGQPTNPRVKKNIYDDSHLTTVDNVHTRPYLALSHEPDAGINHNPPRIVTAIEEEFAHEIHATVFEHVRLLIHLDVIERLESPLAIRKVIL